MKEFVHLHNHSDHSPLDGHATVKEYVDTAVHLGARGLGLTDHGTVGGVYDLLKLSKKAGISAAPGCELYVAPLLEGDEFPKNPVYYGDGGDGDVSAKGAYLHLTVWAYNDIGLHNLFHLSSMSYRKEQYYKKPRISLKQLMEHNEGLIVSTGCPSGEIPTRLILGEHEKALNIADSMKQIFKDRMFIEIMDHAMTGTNLERIYIPGLLVIAKRLGIPLLATNDCHYSINNNGLFQEEMLCSQSNAFMRDKTYDEGGRRFAFDGREYFMKTAQEMYHIFPEHTFPGACKNTIAVAEMMEHDGVYYNPSLRPRLPEIEGFKSYIEYYDHLIEEGIKTRYGDFGGSKEFENIVRERVRKESEVLRSSDFINYMLVVYNYLMFARKNFSVPVDGEYRAAQYERKGELEKLFIETVGNDPEYKTKYLANSIGAGRGSVAGSIVAYLLYITEVDPLQNNLMFERFLTPGRGAQYEFTLADGQKVVAVASDVFVDSEGKEKYVHEFHQGDRILVADNLESETKNENENETETETEAENKP